MTLCPCGTGRPFTACCEPYLEGERAAPTAEALMRARYSAFATGRVDFLMETLLPDEEDPADPQSIREWSENSEWLGLEILSTVEGGEEDDEGMVEFIAQYRPRDGSEDEVVEHRERSFFERMDGRWILAHGEVAQEPYRREGPKVGRNDPCPCGSGRKFKKCCGGVTAAS